MIDGCWFNPFVEIALNRHPVCTNALSRGELQYKFFLKQSDSHSCD